MNIIILHINCQFSSQQLLHSCLIMYHSITCIQTGTGQDIIQHMKPGTEWFLVAVQDTLKLEESVSNAAYDHVSEDGATTILECVSAPVDGLDLIVVLV